MQQFLDQTQNHQRLNLDPSDDFLEMSNQHLLSQLDALIKVVARLAEGVRVSELCAFGDEIILSYVCIPHSGHLSSPPTFIQQERVY